MSQDRAVDFYEVLQISPNADPEMVHRVYRLLAQRFHPDNGDTGDEARFRQITEAYHVLSDPERRAKYDVHHQAIKQERWRLVAAAGEADNDYEMEQRIRLTVLEVLYAQRRMEPNDPGIFDLDMEKLVGRPREHLEFTFWYLLTKKLIVRGERSRLTITGEGVDYLEQNHQERTKVLRLPKAASM
jgi:curved DNA-binding protein CbpA